jgi:hypothetical protein
MANAEVGDPPVNEAMNTKRMTGISLLATENHMHERDTEKKGRKFEYVN